MLSRSPGEVAYPHSYCVETERNRDTPDILRYQDSEGCPWERPQPYHFPSPAAAPPPKKQVDPCYPLYSTIVCAGGMRLCRII